MIPRRSDPRTARALNQLRASSTPEPEPDYPCPVGCGMSFCDCQPDERVDYDDRDHYDRERDI